MKNYQITIGYRAVIQIDVKAETEAEAKKKALDKFAKQRDKIGCKDVHLADDNYKADGIVDQDATWLMYDKD